MSYTTQTNNMQVIWGSPDKENAIEQLEVLFRNIAFRKMWLWR